MTKNTKVIPLMKKTFFKEKQIKKDLIRFIKKTDFFSVSNECRKFEEEFAEYHKKKFSVLFNSGGSANFAMLQALSNLGKLKPGDKVGFSSLTWSTNVMPIIQMGLNPIAVDCNKNTLNSMSDGVEKTIKAFGIKAFFATNVLGMCGDMDQIRKVCNDHNVIFLEDNCEALGTIYKSEKLGTFSDMSSSSFFVAHHMSTIEGGAVLTDDENLFNMLHIVRSNGWDRTLRAEAQQTLRLAHDINDEFQAKYTFYDIGCNMKPTEITGFLARKQLELLDDAIRKRKDIFDQINQSAKNNNNLIELKCDGINRLSPFAFPVVTEEREYMDFLKQEFLQMGVEIRPVIAGNIQNQPFYKKYVKDYIDVPGTEHIDECGFYFGIYPELVADEIEVLKSCLERK